MKDKMIQIWVTENEFLLINPDHIIYLKPPKRDDTVTTVNLSNGMDLKTEEPWQEIVRRINEI